MTTPKRGFGLIYFLPVALFIALAAIFYGRLDAGDPSELPSVLLGQKVPDFDLPALPGALKDGDPVPGLKSSDLTGGITLLNVFASWCVPCRMEHPMLLELAKDNRFRLVGLNYKDENDNAARFIGGLGNPYAAIGVDAKGRTGIDFGVYGVPETFVISARGEILYKHVGPISQESLKEKLMPEIEKALASKAAP